MLGRFTCVIMWAWEVMLTQPIGGHHAHVKIPAPSPCHISKEDDELKALWQNYSTLAGRIDQLEVGLPVAPEMGRDWKQT